MIIYHLLIPNMHIIKAVFIMNLIFKYLKEFGLLNSNF